MKEETLRKVEKWNKLNKIERELYSQGYSTVKVEDLTLEECYELNDSFDCEIFRGRYDKSKLFIEF